MTVKVSGSTKEKRKELEGFDQFSKEKPKSAKLKTKSKWETKIYQLCFKARKANKRNLTKSDCEILFKSLME